MDYKYLLFDLDGTLTDPKEGITKCVQYALNACGIDEPNADKLLRFIGPPLKDAFKEYYSMNDEDISYAIEKYRERFSTIGIFENSVYEGIHKMLDNLSKIEATLAVATSKPTEFAERILERYSLKQYFKVVVGSELDGTRSAKADVISEVFSRLSISENDKIHALMIGDRKHDIIGAKACGIKSVGVQFGYAEENELQSAGADFIVDTVSDLVAFLMH